jgi:hypothetical protein
MQFGKVRMFFYFNGMIALFMLLYFSPWLFSSITSAKVITPYEVTTIQLKYEANGEQYTEGHMRNDIPFEQRTVSIRYLNFHPSSSRINSFMGMFAEPLAWWSVLLLASAMLLLTPNAVFSRGTIFHIHNKFPWISMDEFYPYYGNLKTSGFTTHASENPKPKQQHLLKRNT